MADERKMRMQNAGWMMLRTFAGGYENREDDEENRVILTERLKELAEPEYADFHSNIVPNVPRETILGIRVPRIRALGKEVAGTAEAEEFLNELPKKYYDENMLQAVLISGLKDYDRCIECIDAFLPYVDNWAVCDTIIPKVFGKDKYKDKLIKKVPEWIDSDKTFTIRFGIKVLMSYFLDADFKPEYLKTVSVVRSEEYYVNMMIAWYFATALAKQWDDTIPYIEKDKLDVWTHNKTIQKAWESYRITDERKAYLKGLKRGTKA